MLAGVLAGVLGQWCRATLALLEWALRKVARVILSGYSTGPVSTPPVLVGPVSTLRYARRELDLADELRGYSRVL